MMRTILKTVLCCLLLAGCGKQGGVNSNSGSGNLENQDSVNATETALSDFEYQVEADLTIITKCSGVGDVVIPETIKGAPVTEIGDSAFFGNREMTSVIIPDTVTTIGVTAFKACIGLTSVVIPSSVTSIGSAAFGGCLKLKSVTFLGDAPPETKYMFKDSPATIYYDPNRSGWGKPFACKSQEPIPRSP